MLASDDVEGAAITRVRLSGFFRAAGNSNHRAAGNSDHRSRQPATGACSCIPGSHYRPGRLVG
jgi:hypothetical protein